MISFNFEGKEKYDCIDLMFKKYKKKSFSVDQLCYVLETTDRESIKLILDQMELEGKIESGYIRTSHNNEFVYASKEAYIDDGR